MPNSDSVRLRPRAAFLHISKCAGTSVYTALSAAAGNPVPPAQQFDTCYVDGIDDPSRLSEAARSAVAWDDRPTGVGTHVFYNHWSLPTLRRHFEPADIATVLREPMTRVLSFVEFMRSLPFHYHRHWYPDTVPMATARLPLVDLLAFTGAARSNDNLIARQVMWGDARVPSQGFIGSSDCNGLAVDAIQRLSQLGVVAAVESGDAVRQQLSAWLGVPLTVERRNETPVRQLPGVFRTAAEVIAAEGLLRERTVVDRQIWAHFAALAGVDVDEELVARRVGERLRRWCSSAFFAGFIDGLEPVAPTSMTDAARLLDTAVASDAALLVIGDGADVRLSPARRHRTAVIVEGASAGPANTIVRIVDRDLVNLRDTLTGRDFDAIVVGDEWMNLRSPVRLFAQLAEVAAPHTTISVVGHRATAAGLSRHLRRAGWSEIRTAGHPTGVVVHAANAVPGGAQLADDTAVGVGGEVQAIVAGLVTRAQHVVTLRSADDLHLLESARSGEAAAPDAVVLDGVLSRVDDPAVVLLRAAARVVPGGDVVISIRNPPPTEQRGIRIADLARRFAGESVRQLIESCDLYVVEWHRVEDRPGTARPALGTRVLRCVRRWFHADLDAEAAAWVALCRKRSVNDVNLDLSRSISDSLGQ